MLQTCYYKFIRSGAHFATADYTMEIIGKDNQIAPAFKVTDWLLKK